MQQSFRTSLRIFLSGLYNLRAECFAEITCQDTYFPLERFYRGILNTETTSLGGRLLKCIRLICIYRYFSFVLIMIVPPLIYSTEGIAIMKITIWNRRIVSGLWSLLMCWYRYWESFISLSLENWRLALISVIKHIYKKK